MLRLKTLSGISSFSRVHYLKYDDTDFSLEIAPITRVMAIKAEGSANYGPPCIYTDFKLLNIHLLTGRNVCRSYCHFILFYFILFIY